MSQSILDKYGLRSSGAFADRMDQSLPETTSDTEAHSCYGVLRGSKDRAVHLLLIKLDGRVLAPAYSYIDCIEYDPAGQITLRASGLAVTIVGHNLHAYASQHKTLFTSLTGHRVVWVREIASTDAAGHDERSAVVDRIEWG